MEAFVLSRHEKSKDKSKSVIVAQSNEYLTRIYNKNGTLLYQECALEPLQAGTLDAKVNTFNTYTEALNDKASLAKKILVPRLMPVFIKTDPGVPCLYACCEEYGDLGTIKMISWANMLSLPILHMKFRGIFQTLDVGFLHSVLIYNDKFDENSVIKENGVFLRPSKRSCFAEADLHQQTHGGERVYAENAKQKPLIKKLAGWFKKPGKRSFTSDEVPQSGEVDIQQLARETSTELGYDDMYLWNKYETLKVGGNQAQLVNDVVNSDQIMAEGGEGLLVLHQVMIAAMVLDYVEIKNFFDWQDAHLGGILEEYQLSILKWGFCLAMFSPRDWPNRFGVSAELMIVGFRVMTGNNINEMDFTYLGVTNQLKNYVQLQVLERDKPAFETLCQKIACPPVDPKFDTAAWAQENERTSIFAYAWINKIQRGFSSLLVACKSANASSTFEGHTDAIFIQNLISGRVGPYLATVRNEDRVVFTQAAAAIHAKYSTATQ